MDSLQQKNEEIEKMQEMARIRDEKNREEQQRALEEYQKKAAEEAERQQAVLQEMVHYYMYQFWIVP